MNSQYEPVPEEYSRVTNPERFRPLHGFALELASRLRDSYDVVETEAFELVRGVMRPIDNARPPITLTPNGANAAAISIAFTGFPSLIVRCGRWFFSAFPSCACDACAATAERESERLGWIVDSVVAGQFGEVLESPFFGQPSVKWWFGINDGAHNFSSGGEMLSAERAQAIRAEGVKRVDWGPWPKRAK